MDPAPLPPNTFPPSAFHAAYNQCLILEADAMASRVEQVEACPPPLVCARLLGHLLRLAPAGHGQGQLQREIASAKDHASLMRLAKFYLTVFICGFMRSGGPTPAPSEHPSHESLEDLHDYYSSSTMAERKLDHRIARNLAMRRDDNRCMVTNLLDYKQLARDEPSSRGRAIVEAAHIIPESANANVQEPGNRRSRSANMWTVLSMFSRDNIADDLAGDRIHRPENIISMNNVSHRLFDELLLWFKPVEGVPHTYRVCTRGDWLRHPTLAPIPELVTFSTATDIPLPNSDYLALHALCCEVAWMSAAAEYIMDVERKKDDTDVLANDGSDAEILMNALSFVVLS